MQVTRFPARAAGIADRMAGFVAHLRMNGLKLGPGETGDALGVLSQINAADAQQARLALRALFASDSEGWRTFDDLFDGYWYNAGKQRAGTVATHVRVKSARPTLWQPHLDDGRGDDGNDDGANGDDAQPDTGQSTADGTDGRLIATRADNFLRRDLRELMDDETLRNAERAAEKIARAIRDRRSRRRKRAARGAALDLRRIQRASLARGGEPLDLYRKARPDQPMRIVALCDVSGSMTVYARVFLAFVKGLLDHDTSADAYLFHTRLMRITSALRDPDALRAAGRLSLMAEGFGGGTDIGGSLQAFCNTYAAKALNGRSVVIILSDGYCTGSPEALADALSRIRRKARRIVWLNPLKAWADCAPVAAAMHEAAPYLDAHLPANTIQGLAALESEFTKI